MTAIWLVLGVLATLLAIAEIGLRWQFGFGAPLLYIADERVGYLLAPNQRTRRMGNWIAINQYSMRGGDIDPTPPADTQRVLVLGDSIANGGWWTDQASTIPALIEAAFAHQGVEVLNASANSWGPRNELAYLQRFGDFQARAIVLLINTDDLFATAPTSIPVGRDRFYPDRKPLCALAEAWQRVFPPPPVPEMAAVHQEGGDRVGFNLAAIGEIHALATAAHRRFLLVMTPLLRELGEPGSRDYELVARQRLQDFVTERGIDYLDFLSLFNHATEPATLYRDHIHLSPVGNQQVSGAIADWLRQ